jgi:hypothetical protein
MPWTVEQMREYQARWRAAHPHYQRDLKAWQRQEQAKIKSEFLAKHQQKAKSRKTAAPAMVPCYPWEND